MFLSREIDIKLCQNYTKSYIVCTVEHYVTKTSANSSAVSLSRDTRDQYNALLLVEVSATVQTIRNNIINYIY